MLIYDVDNLYEFIKDKLINSLLSKEISAMEGEHLTIFHMHGLAGFYGPKILIRLNENSVDLDFKLFSILQNKVVFYFDNSNYSFHLYSESDININSYKNYSNLTEKDILEILDIYTHIFKTIVVNKDDISSNLFNLANAVEGKLIFNKVSLPIDNEYREYRVAIKENNVYIDDLFSEGYFPSKSYFKIVSENIHNKFLPEYLPDEITWYQLKKENDFIKVDKITSEGNSISSVSFDKKFLAEFINSFIKTNTSIGDRI